jgi:outer membrane protein TolC
MDLPWSQAAALLLALAAITARAQQFHPPDRGPREALLATPHEELLPPGSSNPATPPPRAITLAEAKGLALQNSRVMRLASLQIFEKRHAAAAASKDYFPKLLGSVNYFRFDEDLGTVITTEGRILAARQIAVPLINQDAPMGMLTVAQPVTALYKVRQAVTFSNAEVGTAQAQAVLARREISKGVEQAYFALLTLQKSHAAALAGVQGAGQLAAALGNSPEARIVEVEARQLLSQSEHQMLQLETVLNDLLDWPLCTPLVLSDPPPIECLVECEADAAVMAVQVSPKIREAQQLVVKANAGLNLAKSELVPSVNVVGTYVAQDAMPTIQEDFYGAGVLVNHTMFEWGKKKHVLHQRQTGVAMAVANLRKVEGDVRLAAIKAYQDFRLAEQDTASMQQIARYYAQVKPPTEPYQIIELAKQRMRAETKALEAQIALRAKYAELMALLGDN